MSGHGTEAAGSEAPARGASLGTEFTLKEALRYNPEKVGALELEGGRLEVWQTGPGWVAWFSYGRSLHRPCACATKLDLILVLYDHLEAHEFADLSWQLVGKVF